LILVDTGPLVALFDPRDDAHAGAEELLATIEDELVTTVPVLTEAFHLLGPSSKGARALRAFVEGRGLTVWWLGETSLQRAFRLMEEYDDHPMDLADASLVAAAESLRTTKVFTIDRRDFLTYRAKIGRRGRAFTLVGH
jgi:predicted nucleic acid-binding protein